VDALITAARAKIPGLCERPLTYADFLALCRRERLRVDVRPWLFDEQLNRRGPRPTITLAAGLATTYKTFLGFHALAHWFLHPGTEDAYLGSPGWLDAIELEASTIGMLALARHRGPPYPIVRRAHLQGNEMLLWVMYPKLPGTEGAEYDAPRFRGMSGARGLSQTSRGRPTRLQRYLDQLEFEW
jgi:hypothetical protein